MIIKCKNTMAFGILWKYFGRERRKLCMLANASMAVPSTTSMTVMPIKFGTKDMWAKWTAIAPPIEWPTTKSCGTSSGYSFKIRSPMSLGKKYFEINTNSSTLTVSKITTFISFTQNYYIFL